MDDDEHNATPALGALKCSAAPRWKGCCKCYWWNGARDVDSISARRRRRRRRRRRFVVLFLQSIREMHNDDDVDVVVAAAVVAYKECSRLNAPAALCQAKVGLTPRPHTNIKEFVAWIQQKKNFSLRGLTNLRKEKKKNKLFVAFLHLHYVKCHFFIYFFLRLVFF